MTLLSELKIVLIVYMDGMVILRKLIITYCW